MLVTALMRAKLGDLRAARFGDASFLIGPIRPEYVAPEILQGGRNCSSADIFSMGITLCELFTGEEPVPDERRRQLHLVQLTDLRDLCLRMTALQPIERIHISECLSAIDNVVRTDDYSSCPPRRMIKGKPDGEDSVILTDRPW